MKKDLLKLLDLTEDEILTILDTADRLKAEWKKYRRHDFPAGKTLAMIFSKNSPGRASLSRRAFTSWAGTAYSCPAPTASWGGASRFRIRRAF
jgi:ornithine carbamoyltransferase